MTAPRLSKLSTIIALHDDQATTDGQRQACHHVGSKIAAALGIEFSKEAVDRAIRGARAEESDTDRVEWLSRVEAIHLDKNERAFLAGVRAGVRNHCFGLFGDSLSRMNALLRAAFEGSRP